MFINNKNKTQDNIPESLSTEITTFFLFKALQVIL